MSSSHSIHAIGYHLVFCTKFRKPVLVNGLDVETKQILAEVCSEYGWLLHSVEIMPDHVHLFVQCDHTTTPVDMVRTLKSISAVYLFTKWAHLKKSSFWGTGLWSRGAYYATVGSMTEGAVKKYIESQRQISGKPESV